MEFFLKGILIGFSIAMPVGPIGLLCLRNVLSLGLLCGLVTGLGAACADAFYGALAAFGVAAISSFLEAYGIYIKLIGAIFLCFLGLTTFFAQAAEFESQKICSTPFRAFLATFFLTLTNPMTILSFAGIYAGLGIGVENSSLTEPFVTTAGVFLGSAAWWLILSLVASILREKMTAKSSQWLNKISGSMLCGFGVLALI